MGATRPMHQEPWPTAIWFAEGQRPNGRSEPAMVTNILRHHAAFTSRSAPPPKPRSLPNNAAYLDAECSPTNAPDVRQGNILVQVHAMARVSLA
eukprot:2293210-Alexandrium_andersonii.AAC.1